MDDSPPRHPEAFLATCPRLSERALLSKGTGEAVSGQHRGQAGQAEALMEQIACQQVDIPRQKAAGLAIVAQSKEGLAQAEIGLDLEGEIAEAFVEGERTLARFDRVLLVPIHQE